MRENVTDLVLDGTAQLVFAAAALILPRLCGEAGYERTIVVGAVFLSYGHRLRMSTLGL